MDKIKHTNECDNGFVIIQKGAFEGRNDNLSNKFGFCLQRNSPSIADLGETAFHLAENIVRKDLQPKKNKKPEDFERRIKVAAKKYLDKKLDQTFTYTRKSFITDQCLFVPYFRDILLRDLQNIKILHYIHKESRDWHSDFIKGRLQARHDLIMRGEGGSLLDLNMKLILNSFYGYAMLE